MAKIKLVYIFGHGKSGSTLLDMILGAQEGIESVGEIINLDIYLRENLQCSCGKPILDCGYWNRVLEIADRNLSGFGIEGDTHKYPLTAGLQDFKKDEKQELLLKRLKNRLDEKDIHLYNSINYCLMKAILEYSGKRIIVDSSKNYLRALALSASDSFELKIIHLYRDHRDVLCSKKLKAMKKEENTVWRGMGRECAEMWGSIMHKYLVLKCLRGEGKINVYKISYKELYSNPYESLEHLCGFTGTAFDPSTIDPLSPNHFSNNIQHNIGGNRLRFKKVDRLKYIQKWPDKLSRREKLIFALAGGHLCNFIQKKG